MGLIRFVFLNFGPLLVFYAANHFYGLKVAVLVSVIWTVGEILFKVVQKLPVSPFFLFTAAVVVIFGLVDLYLQQSVLFKFEAALSSMMMGVFFAASLFGGKPIIREIAEAQGRIAKELSPDGEYYFRFLTQAWSFSFFAKAAFYVWVALNYSLEQGLVIRGIVGSATTYGLMFVSIFGAKQIKGLLAQLGLLPSSQDGVRRGQDVRVS